MSSPLVVIVGPTASGKTSLGVSLALEFSGEIISADSRAIYRELSVGTAKPTLDEQKGIPHWGIDLVDPGQRFTASDFQSYAKSKIAEIRSRGKIPFLVGGTGLYIDSVVYDFEFPMVSNDVGRRDILMTASIEELHVYCVENNIPLPENVQNKRYLVNSILRGGLDLQRKHKLDEDIIVVGIATEKSLLTERIEARARTIFDHGVIEEASAVAEKYGWDSEAMTGNVYPLIHEYLEGRITHEEMTERFIIADRRLAKRQLTWFRRNKDIVWLDLDGAYKYIARKLS